MTGVDDPRNDSEVRVAFYGATNPMPTDGAGDGVAFEDAIGLGHAIPDNPATTACLVNRMYSYATGHAVSRKDSQFLGYLEETFAADNYKVTELLRRIATSDAFYKVATAANVASR